MNTICGVYMIQNMVNGKIYIGQSIDIHRRWRDHKNDSKNKKENRYFYCAIRKYGYENFSFSIIEECDVSELSYMEKKYIQLFHSNDKQFGYNMENGGNMPGKRSPETIQRIKETKAKNPYRYTEEVKKKMSEAGKKRHTHRLPKIRCLESGEEKYASDWIDEGYRFAIETAKGFYRQCKGLHFEFTEQPKGNEKRKIRCLETNELCTELEWRQKGYSLAGKVAAGKMSDTKGKHFMFAEGTSVYREKLVRCLETGEILSSKDWALKGIHNTRLVCLGKRKTAGGYHFEYLKETACASDR